jgi:hypothetical protein
MEYIWFEIVDIKYNYKQNWFIVVSFVIRKKGFPLTRKEYEKTFQGNENVPLFCTGSVNFHIF